MKHLELLEHLSGKVNFPILQQYLLTRHWRKVGVSTDIAFFISPNDNAKLDITLPLSRNFADYSESILKAIKKLASFESRDEIQIINDLIAPPADIVRFRIDNASTDGGIIPLKDGFDLLESARKALLSTASDLVSPALFHKRMTYRDAVQFIDSCYLGQTERGSYIASIVCPFIRPSNDEKPIQLSLFSGEDALQESFTRGITRKLMNSISVVKTAIESADYSSLLQPEPQNTISSNFLESIVEINEFTQHSKIEISLTWAPTVLVPDNVPSRIEITNDYIEPIKQIINLLRPEATEEPGDYIGKITEIKAAPNLNDRQGGDVTVIFISNENKIVNARVYLAYDDLVKAFEAFEAGKNVKVSGVLKMLARQKTIENAVFSVVN